MLMNILKIPVLLIFFATLAYSQYISYPYPSDSITFTLESQQLVMSYMDVKPDPAAANGKSVILFHGKNFNGYYWKDVIEFFVGSGYRVIAPDQVGWGKSSRANIHYSFHLLALNNKGLLDSLGIEKVNVIGHSTGGMLAARFVLMYPERTEKLVLENPVGLEDYRLFVPYQPVEAQYIRELAATYNSIKEYQKTYYPEWKDEYEHYVLAQSQDLSRDDFRNVAWANALTYQMIYEQPVIYELKDITVPTLLVIGQYDRTVVGKNLLNEEAKQIYGNYPSLGKKVNSLINGSKLVELENVGHIPHVQALPEFLKQVSDFLRE
ncbi:MAG: alpha/beta hydrolase [Ignavibacteria bacterium]|nr:alpha/beta hydrolase [Ignavibacteria bacterium]